MTSKSLKWFHGAESFETCWLAIHLPKLTVRVDHSNIKQTLSENHEALPGICKEVGTLGTHAVLVSAGISPR